MADREDFLTEDPEIPSQRFALLSFLSPERVLAKKDTFFFDAFLKNYEFGVRTKQLEAFLMRQAGVINEKLDAEAAKFDERDLSGVADICRSSRIRLDEIMAEFQGFVKKHVADLNVSKLKEQYDDFMFTNRQQLEDKFYAANDFRTTVRGLKIRGVYGSQDEAVSRSKKLQRMDTLHNIYVAEVGKWLPWDPEPVDVPNQEYAEEQLNTLMKKYKENEDARASEAPKLRAEHDRLKKTTAAPLESTTEQIATNYEGMFGSSGAPDLAIARKMGEQ